MASVVIVVTIVMARIWSPKMAAIAAIFDSATLMVARMVVLFVMVGLVVVQC